MNELIKTLREKAYTIVSEECQARGELYEAREYNERCDQVFAELIVQQTIKHLLNSKYDEEEFRTDDPFYHGYNTAVDSNIEGIKEYFGFGQ